MSVIVFPCLLGHARLFLGILQFPQLWERTCKMTKNIRKMDAVTTMHETLRCLWSKKQHHQHHQHNLCGTRCFFCSILALFLGAASYWLFAEIPIRIGKTQCSYVLSPNFPWLSSQLASHFCSSWVKSPSRPPSNDASSHFFSHWLNINKEQLPSVTWWCLCMDATCIPGWLYL